MNDITICELARWGAMFKLGARTVYVWAHDADADGDEMRARMREAGFSVGRGLGVTVFTRPREVQK